MITRSSLDEVKAHDTALLSSLSKKFNLTYTAFRKRISEEGVPASSSLTLSDAYNGGLEPAPITPTGKDAAPYQLLSGTIKATYNAHRSLSDNDESVIVAPSMMSGNTGALSCSCPLCAVYWRNTAAQIHVTTGNYPNTYSATITMIARMWRVEFIPSMNVSFHVISIFVIMLTRSIFFFLVMEIDGFLEMIRFFTTLILNVDESTSL